MSRLVVAFVLVLATARTAGAQWTVYDPANVARNTTTAILKQYLVETQRSQRQQIERMARRLSQVTDLRKFSLPEPPMWRIHDFWTENVRPLAREYHAALNYGDRLGHGILAVSHDVQRADDLLGRLSPAAARAMSARLATLDVATAALIASTHDAGQTRFNGRRELAAIEALDSHVIDPSDEQSTTAVLEKINGAGLIATRQQQARIQLLAGIVEELLVGTKRTRDADAAAMNMQLTTWREGRQANEAFVSGSGDALRTWRQP